MFNERLARRILIAIALLGLAAGGVAILAGQVFLARTIWAAATGPVVVALAISIVRDLAAGRPGSQRVIESIDALVRIHNAQAEDVYENAAAA
ncbi:MAG TPA: hypothetical protein VGA65_07050 [Hyphomicrobium sp.]|jgi:hypothetical protein